MSRGISAGAGYFDPASSSSGIFEITYTYEDPGSCTNGSATSSIEVDICDLVLESSMLQLVVYPNPTTDLLFVNVQASCPFIITNLQGKTVKSGVAMPYLPIDLKSISPGVYVIHMNTQNDNRSAKICITE